MLRRSFIAGSLAALASAAPRRRYKAAVIGHTGRGNYGHGLDVVWREFDFVDVAAVADPDPRGREQALARCGAQRAYADYREMLRRERPDLVSIGPRHLDQRVEMVTAAAEAGAHIFMEKPFAQDLEDADRLVEAVRKAGVKVQIAHQMRTAPYTLRVKEMIEAGEIGQIQEVRGRGKEDNRAGGEDLMVLGSHIVDVMRMLLGDPRWVFAHVTTDGEELRPEHRGRPGEPIGPIAGREIAAVFAFDGGVHGYLASRESPETDPLRFGTVIYGSRGVIFLPNAIYPGPQPFILRSASWMPLGDARWEPVEASPPAGADFSKQIIANALMVSDLIDAIENDRKPACSELDGRWTIEMIVGVYRSQTTGGRVEFPLADRAHPLRSL